MLVWYSPVRSATDRPRTRAQAAPVRSPPFNKEEALASYCAMTSAAAPRSSASNRRTSLLGSSAGFGFDTLHPKAPSTGPTSRQAITMRRMRRLLCSNTSLSEAVRGRRWKRALLPARKRWMASASASGSSRAQVAGAPRCRASRLVSTITEGLGRAWAFDRERPWTAARVVAYVPPSPMMAKGAQKIGCA